MRRRDGQRALIGVGTAAVGVVIAGCTAAPAPTERPSATSTTYRDGVYEATGWYGGLPSHHDVTLTIENDLVIAVAISTPAEDETSLGYQQRFAAALPDAVIGRSVDELEIDRLAGSSGCSAGFMDALAKIRTDARAWRAAGPDAATRALNGTANTRPPQAPGARRTLRAARATRRRRRGRSPSPRGIRPAPRP